MDTEARKLLNQTCYGAVPMGTSQAGDQVYAAPSAFLARVEPHVQYLNTSPQGEEVVTSHMLITEHVATSSERLWLPGISPTDNDESARLAKAINPIYDENGTVSHYEVLV